MKLRPNRIQERAGVNSVRAFFESQGCVFQEIDAGNDYGKDAYVDLGEAGKVTGTCIALQIKSGKSFRREHGYAIPVESHERYWKDSTLPIVGIVHDPDDDSLYWCDISGFLRANTPVVPQSIPVSRSNRLSRDQLPHTFFSRLLSVSKLHNFGTAILQLHVQDVDRQQSALQDCFAIGRNDARVLVTVRYLLRLLHGEALGMAIFFLGHATPHPDIFWRADNWIPEDVEREVQKHFVWSVDEIQFLLRAVEWEQWHRGGLGEYLYMILKADPERRQKMLDVVRAASDQNDLSTAFIATYLSVYWEQSDPAELLNRLLRQNTNLFQHEMLVELKSAVDEFGQIYLFE